MDGMLEYALDWAGRGFRIFPLHPGSKRPVWKGWTEDATTDPERIKAIWSERDYNIGVLTDDLIVIDVDMKNGKDGFSSLLDLGLPLDTLTVKTPSGGFHFYYKGGPVANSAGKLGDGLDVRSYHGYVLAPGSMVSGGAYRLSVDGLLVSLSGSLRDRFDPPRLRAETTVSVDLDDPGAVDHARQWLASQPGAVEGNSGDLYTYRTAAKLKDYGLSEPVALDLLRDWNARCEPPWDDADLHAKVANAYAYGTSPPGVANPAHQFAGVTVAADPHAPAVNGPWFDRDDDWRGSVEWLYPDLLPTTGVCIMAGPSNSGKTFAALDLAESLAIQRPFFGTSPEQPGSVLILAGEAFGSMKMRMQALQKGLPVSATYVGGLAARGAWAELVGRLEAKAAEMDLRFGMPVRLIILDTLSSSGILADENNNAEAATVMKAFAELSARMKALFLILHHPPKSGDGERGAGAIRNNADYVMSIRREGTSAVREIEMTKSRDAETKVFGTFTLEPVTIGADAKGKEIKTMRISAGLPRVRETRAGQAHAEAVIQAVEFALVQNTVLVEGESWTPEREVADTFIQFWKGSKTSTGAIMRQFNAAMRYVIDMGSVDALKHDNTVYYKRKELL